MNASRTLLNTIVQGSTVELFHSNRIAVAPLPAMKVQLGQPRHFNLVGVVAFNAPKLSGSLALSLAEGIYGMFEPPIVGMTASSNMLRELTNQLAGRVKNRLLQFQLTLHVGLPSTMNGEALERRQPRTADEILYAFRTLRGELRVTLDAIVDESALNYSNSVKVAKEGDFIPF